MPKKFFEEINNEDVDVDDLLEVGEDFFDDPEEYEDYDPDEDEDEDEEDEDDEDDEDDDDVVPLDEIFDD
jgi:hypothetical protein